MRDKPSVSKRRFAALYELMKPSPLWAAMKEKGHLRHRHDHRGDVI